MTLDFALFCDLVQAGAGIKPNILGMFEMVNAPQLPHTIHPFYLYSRFRLTSGEMNEMSGKIIDIGVDLLSPQKVSKTIVKHSSTGSVADMQLARPEDGGPPIIFAFAMLCVGLQVEEYGNHLTTITVDGHSFVGPELYVRHLEE